MRELVRKVLELQGAWTHANTPQMQVRGDLVRKQIPAWLRERTQGLASTLGPAGQDLLVEGRDGTGQKTEIPWIRFCSRSRSPSAQDGWYCVYLFDATGAGFYLALAHGSTKFENGEFRPREASEVNSFMDWARRQLASAIREHPEWSEEIDLRARRSGLGDAYRRTTLLAKWYAADEVPMEDGLEADALLFAGFLRRLYEADDLGLSPGSETPEVRAVREAADPVRSGRGSRQGFGLTVAERRAVEAHAMAVAQSRLEALGFNVEDVSRVKPYDFVARRGGAELIVEVKGTTSLGEQVVLTSGELNAHRTAHPNNALLVIHSIELVERGSEPAARGGHCREFFHWDTAACTLEPISYMCALPAG